MEHFLQPIPHILAADTQASGSSAWFTVLGASVTAVATVVALLLKYHLDRRAQSDAHKQELEKITVTASHARKEREWVGAKEAYVGFLVATHDVFRQTDNAIAGLPPLADPTTRMAALRSIRPDVAQARLEELRLLTQSKYPQECAEALWRHLRGAASPLGAEFAGVTPWRKHYWKLRTELVDACRSDLAASPGDAL